MEIHYNSINARLYRWFYNVSDMPQSLCPYFWKLLWLHMAIIPMLVFTLPIQIYDKFDKQDNSERLKGGLIGYGILFFGLAMISSLSLLFGFKPIDNHSFISKYIGLGIALWCVLILVGLIIAIIKLVEYKKRKYYYEYPDDDDYEDFYYGRKYYFDKNHQRVYVDEQEEKDSLLVAFIKAKYNRYCPKITWKKD